MTIYIKRYVMAEARKKKPHTHDMFIMMQMREVRNTPKKKKKWVKKKKTRNHN